MDIILPDDEQDSFEYFVVTTFTVRPIQTAMVKFPRTLSNAFADELEQTEESNLVWYLTERREEVDENGENPASRYELRGSVYVAPDIPPPQTEEEAEQILQDFRDALDQNNRKDGYVYFPMAMRDGRHADQYILQACNKDFFTTRTERGMFEEVAWSPFGTIGEAAKQEAKNLERNPLLRNWA